MKTRILFACTAVLFLSGCNTLKPINTDIYGYSLLMPVGAPTLSLYHEICVEDGLVTTNNPTLIPSEFTKNNYDFLVFDSTQVTQKFEGKDTFNYEYEMMLTGGSFHLISFGKTQNDYQNIDEKDYIISFGAESAAINKLYSSVYDVKIDEYVNSVSILLQMLTKLDNNFSVEGKTIDYALLSEPQVTVLKKIWQKNNLNFDNIFDINLQKEFKTNHKEWGFDYIPQAALYVNKEFKSKNNELYLKIIDRITSQIDNTIYNPDVVNTKINETFKTSDEQKEVFGFTTEQVLEVQGNKNNGFGIVPTDIHRKINVESIKQYLELIK